uniref:Uncharacterized protein n=1 Tax=Poecilia mexicana TaxID=48701 RepID=A0A3B3WQK4_9TELE
MEQSALLTAKTSEVVLCGDGRCDPPGHSAKYCTYTFLDVASQNIIDFKVISWTQASSSNATKTNGFKEALKNIEQNGVKVITVCTDRHPQIIKEMRVNNPKKRHEFGRWHVARGVSKKLAAAAKWKSCEDLAEWIRSIINHFWWRTQTCGGNAETLKEKWVSLIHHVTNRHDCQRTKLWLRPGSDAHVGKMIKDKQLLKDLDRLTKISVLAGQSSLSEKQQSQSVQFLLDEQNLHHLVTFVFSPSLLQLNRDRRVEAEETVGFRGQGWG